MRLIRQGLCFAVLMVAALLPTLARADAWSVPAANLARKIAEKAGPGSAITLAVKNNSSLATGDVAAVRAQVQAGLEASGLRMVDASQAVANVTLMLSENVEGYLWVAQVQQGSTEDVVMVAVPRPATSGFRAASAMTLRRRLLLAQDEPILDVAVRPDSIVVLSPSKVTYYRVQGRDWQELMSLPIKHSRPFPRDVRGKIWSAGENALDVSLPGLHCTQSGTQASGLNCTDTDDPWPLSVPGEQIGLSAFYAPARNFFNGTVIFQDATAKGQTSSYDLPPFYSVAVATEQGLPLWLFDGVDGRVTFFGGQRGTMGTTAAIRGWGSDIATIASPCGGERLVLASGNGDNTVRDSVAAYQVANRDAVALTAPVEFAGPVTTLWTSSVESQTAIAVGHNLNTGKYEAYALSLACNQ